MTNIISFMLLPLLRIVLCGDTVEQDKRSIDAVRLMTGLDVTFT